VDGGKGCAGNLTDLLRELPASEWSVSHPGEGFEGGFVGVGEGVEVLLSGAEASVAEALLDDLEVVVGPLS
jgi:hypothetical protein